MKFLWRSPSGKIVKTVGETANQSLNQLGTPIGWDSDLNSVDVLRPFGKVEKFVLTGSV